MSFFNDNCHRSIVPAAHQITRGLLPITKRKLRLCARRRFSTIIATGQSCLQHTRSLGVAADSIKKKIAALRKTLLCNDNCHGPIVLAAHPITWGLQPITLQILQQESTISSNPPTGVDKKKGCAQKSTRDSSSSSTT